jgi:hypothetical protein
VAAYPLPDFLDFRIFFIRDLLIGALIVTVLLLRPQGLLPEERRVSRWLERQTRGSGNLKRSGAPPPAEEEKEEGPIRN